MTTTPLDIVEAVQKLREHRDLIRLGGDVDMYENHAGVVIDGRHQMSRIHAGAAQTPRPRQSR